MDEAVMRAYTSYEMYAYTVSVPNGPLGIIYMMAPTKAAAVEQVMAYWEEVHAQHPGIPSHEFLKAGLQLGFAYNRSKHRIDIRDLRLVLSTCSVKQDASAVKMGYSLSDQIHYEATATCSLSVLQREIRNLEKLWASKRFTEQMRRNLYSPRIVDITTEVIPGWPIDRYGRIDLPTKGYVPYGRNWNCFI